VRLLKNSGFEHVQHLKGGINAWTEEIDPKQGKY
jgi:rhodanese-related sulfurtransferase